MAVGSSSSTRPWDSSAPVPGRNFLGVSADGELEVEDGEQDRGDLGEQEKSFLTLWGALRDETGEHDHLRPLHHAEAEDSTTFFPKPDPVVVCSCVVAAILLSFLCLFLAGYRYTRFMEDASGQHRVADEVDAIAQLQTDDQSPSSSDTHCHHDVSAETEGHSSTTNDEAKVVSDKTPLLRGESGADDHSSSTDSTTGKASQGSLEDKTILLDETQTALATGTAVRSSEITDDHTGQQAAIKLM